MNDRKKTGGVSMTGASSLLIIFAVLCLTIFALLTLNTAAAGKRLSQRAAQQTADYYAAEAQAHGILAALREGQLPEGVAAEGDVYRYSCAISENTLLEVEVRLLPGKQYEILRWQSVSTLDWQFDDDIDVWDGELLF